MVAWAAGGGAGDGGDDATQASGEGEPERRERAGIWSLSSGTSPETAAFPNSTLLFLKMQASYRVALTTSAGAPVPPARCRPGATRSRARSCSPPSAAACSTRWRRRSPSTGTARPPSPTSSACAGVSRKTFYEHFSDKEDCFLALYDTGIAYVLGRIVEARRRRGASTATRRRASGRRARGVPRRARRGARVQPRDHPRGPRGRAAGAATRRRATLEAFAQRYEDINAQVRAKDPSIPPLAHDIALAVVGAILELVAHLHRRRPRPPSSPSSPALLTDFVERHVAPRATG